MPMEIFRQTSSLPGSERRGSMAGREVGKSRKRPSIGKAAESFQTKLIASLRYVRRKGSREDLAQNRSSLFLAAFFRLPNELHVHILTDLCISDLLVLRRTCRALNDLIATCGPSLVRYWSKHRMGSLHTQLYPPPPPNGADLHYLLAMRRRHIASIRLTRQLVDFVLGDTLQQTSQRQRRVWTSVYEKMIPLVFGVGYFLEEHRRAVLERDLGRIRPRSHIGYDICTTAGITNQERAIFNRLDPPLRLQFYFMYCFVLQVLTRKLRTPTYAGSMEKFLRGWSEQRVCSEDIAFVLVLGGIGQIAKLLACPTYGERRRLLHTFITRLSPHESVTWRKHWRDVGVISPALLDDMPCTSIGITQLEQIWEPLIKELVKPESREFTECQKAKYMEVKASRKFVNELMGYDIFRGRLADEEDSEDEEHRVQ